ncbi:hypothetical protein [Nguyenibacter sp. L1]|uniref:hypothetical protein n=1 Tax=Nguyenibacter sp. L1 TaxID=3049350 RepID=UPI002B493A0A|nr:hypothetical protein [Nguyenibacter sp. L1]WRH88556.1 hypothetical protein QN315_02695 [Nguyenibacter sp. L1]
MSKILRFTDRGWDVITSAWTVGAKNSRCVELCYTWTPAIGFDNSVGSARVTLHLNIDDFVNRLSLDTSIIDLRDI